MTPHNHIIHSIEQIMEGVTFAMRSARDVMLDKPWAGIDVDAIDQFSGLHHCKYFVVVLLL
jgi:hypothetical protein